MPNVSTLPEPPRPGSLWQRNGTDDVIVTEIIPTGSEPVVEYFEVDDRGISPWANTRTVSEFLARFTPKAR